jgi:MFS family permease
MIDDEAASQRLRERPPLREVCLDQSDEFSPEHRRSQRSSTRCLVDGASDGARKNLRTDERAIGHATSVRLEQRFIALLAFRCENIVSIARILAAWTLFDENPVSCRIPAMNGNHPIDECGDATLPRRSFVPTGAQDLKYFIKVTPPHGLDQGELVRKILIERANADAGDIRHGIGRQAGPSPLTQNVSRSIEDRVDCGFRARLERRFPHRARWLRNASSQMPLLLQNMSNMLAFRMRVQVTSAAAGTITLKGQREIYRRRDLPIYLGARFLSEVAALGQSVAVSWTVYELSNSPLALGIVGIVQFVPMAMLTLPAGEICDRLSPRRILIRGLALQSLCAAALLVLVILHSTDLRAFYVVLLVLGAARAFADPAALALLPTLLPARKLPRAIAWNSSLWQLAVIAGPVLGGLAYAFGPEVAYAVCTLGFLMAMLAVTALGGRHRAVGESVPLTTRVARMVEGIEFIGSQPIVLGSISLDLFAVLLGGATALLPIYARDILHVGPTDLGLLRSAPAIGACLVALVQTRHPPNRHLGLQLFSAVAIFGIATLIFALSTSFFLSLASLVVLGAGDMLSVNIRSSLVQLVTPDSMRGRVSALNVLFIGASSELGAFESGVAAALLGTVPAVIFGGVGTLIVAAVWMGAFPALRKADRVSSAAPHHSESFND